MNEEAFRDWLRQKQNKYGEPYSENGINTRIRDLKKDDELLGGIDNHIQDEDSMYKALLRLKELDNPSHERLQTALRRYWEFVKGYDFPKIKDYKTN